MSVPTRTVVCGVGLIGGSLAAAGKRAGALAHVVGVGRSRANLDVALERGLVDEVVEAGGDACAAAMREADLIVLAAPVATSLELLAVAARASTSTSVITDVCSVKAPLCERAAQLGIADRFVGAHPMAGSEQSGACAADVDLFRDRVTVVTSGGASAAREVVVDLWNAVGSRVLELDAAEHDRLTAVTSHLPQMAVFALAAAIDAAADSAAVRELAGQGVRDATRLAASEHAMWISIARANRDRLLDAMDAFTAEWSRLRAAVDGGDEAAMRAVMEAAARARRTIAS